MKKCKACGRVWRGLKLDPPWGCVLCGAPEVTAEQSRAILEREWPEGDSEDLAIMIMRRLDEDETIHLQDPS